MPYNASVRRFALVVSCKSKSAYRWIRQKFSRHLPAIRTLRSWHANSNCSFQFGFNEQSIITLTERVKEGTTEAKNVYVSMCFDEISIRRHIQWVHPLKRYSGLVTYGRRDNDEHPVANNAIFFLLNLIETGESIILGYFLIKSLCGHEKVQLITEAITKVNSTGAHLVSIAFDGLTSNFSACRILGASFDIENLHPFISNPENNQQIAIVLDPPHMLKLLRNALASKGHLKDSNNNDIAWSYFESLVLVKSNLASHKMTREHINFASNKMCVRLAAQTYSSSVANSMEILLRNGDPSFRNAAGTIIFTKNVNKLFDILNSKHVDSINLFKRGLNLGNAQQVFVFVDYVYDYIKSLQLNGQNILETDRHTGFLGFLINMVVLRFLYKEYIVPKKLDNILFYYLGQDMLEALFSRVRSMLGANTNPTAEQLSGILRQLVAFNELKASKIASCQDNLNILFVSSLSKKSKVTKELYPFQNDDEEENSVPNMILNFRDNYTIKIRAGTIEKKVRYGNHRCNECKNIFSHDDDKIEGYFVENGLVQRPTKSTMKICKIIYTNFTIHNDIYNFDYDKFYRQILKSIPFDELYTNLNFDHDKNHKSQYILMIIDEYIRMHATYIARIATIQLHSKFMGKTAQKLKQELGQ